MEINFQINLGPKRTFYADTTGKDTVPCLQPILIAIATTTKSSMPIYYILNQR